MMLLSGLLRDLHFRRFNELLLTILNRLRLDSVCFRAFLLMTHSSYQYLLPKFSPETLSRRGS